MPRPTSPAGPTPPPPPIPWGRALVVVGVIAVAHLGFFLLLTTSARSQIAELDERYGRAALVRAEDPGARPTNTAETARWLRAQQLFEASRTREDRAEFVSLLGWGLLGSFGVQAAILASLLYRSVHAARRHGA